MNDWDRDRNCESDRHGVPNSEYSNDYECRHYKGASQPQVGRLSSLPTRTSSDRSRSLSRDLSPPARSCSPPSRSEQRQKRRLPTPRSSVLVSPKYDYGRDREQARSDESEREVGRPNGDHYEPYGREVYRNRKRGF